MCVNSGHQPLVVSKAKAKTHLLIHLCPSLSPCVGNEVVQGIGSIIVKSLKTSSFVENQIVRSFASMSNITTSIWFSTQILYMHCID